MKIQHILKTTGMPSQGLFIIIQVKVLFLSLLRSYYIGDMVPDLKSTVGQTTVPDGTIRVQKGR